MKTIDFENHFATEAWVQALRANTDYPRIVDDAGGKSRLYFAADAYLPFGVEEKLLDLHGARLELMDSAGVDVAVLSLTAPGVEALAPSVGTALAKSSNDELAVAIDKHPDRYLGWASLAPKDPDSATRELERCVRDLGFVGWNTHCNFGDSYLDEKRYWPILAKAEELDVPIYLHPTVPIIPQFRTYGQGLAGASFGFGAETAMVMMRLIMSGAFDAFPTLRIVLGHYAEGLPFMLNRVDRPYLGGHVETDPTLAPTLKRMPSAYLRQNMIATTSGNYNTEAFDCTLKGLGCDCLLLGTDYPFESMKACVDFLESQAWGDGEREWTFAGTSVLSDRRPA
jgi:uncharacterized protein